MDLVPPTPCTLSQERPKPLSQILGFPWRAGFPGCQGTIFNPMQLIPCRHGGAPLAKIIQSQQPVPVKLDHGCFVIDRWWEKRNTEGR